jgi:hypothetical protein
MYQGKGHMTSHELVDTGLHVDRGYSLKNDGCLDPTLGK